MIEVKVPMLPESIADATIATWHKKPGDRVSRDENLVDLETDKVMLEVPAPADGVIKEILKGNGETVQDNQVIAVIEAGKAAETCRKPSLKKQSRQSACKKYRSSGISADPPLVEQRLNMMSIFQKSKGQEKMGV